MLFQPKVSSFVPAGNLRQRHGNRRALIFVPHEFLAEGLAHEPTLLITFVLAANITKVNIGILVWRWLHRFVVAADDPVPSVAIA